ncbi:tetratricopeptide repeat protein [Micromonospora sp. ALFpr18c]|uniref:tetratricopeptide repeat protein n=1 Tax=unclassified Micromonospora TaxID=2617518 RepID=UPI00124B8C3D|nr:MULTISPECIES: tetratricopeptide repeat protein [unclassified Micromonospora]KAB1947682.1 tetratricopeptide repeat protein [Micromonospora sp. ALFpr18c]MDG4759109.1 tetratricopeptide repeat protein [Micromonospora sp. WMMD710]
MSFSDDVRSAFRRGETDAVVRMSETEIERARKAGDPAGEVEARYSLARVALRGGDLSGGEARAREALGVALRSGDRSLEERPRHVLAAVARMSGDLGRARVLYQESIALNEVLDQPRMVATEMHNLALCELGLGNLDVARKLLAESRERIFRNDWTDFVPYVCLAGAVLASTEGDHARAARLSGVAEAAFAALGQVPDPDDAADLAAVRTVGVKALGVNAFALERARGKHLDPRTVLDDDHH